MAIFAYLILGLLLAAPLLYVANRRNDHGCARLLGRALIVAAAIYVLFAIIWGGVGWIGIELLGVVVYGFFYYLYRKSSALWLALGWLAHPLWDIVLHYHGPGSRIAPTWYTVACISFDAVVAVYILFRYFPKKS